LPAGVHHHIAAIVLCKRKLDGDAAGEVFVKRPIPAYYGGFVLRCNESRGGSTAWQSLSLVLAAKL
jgi:hypothetical protein